MGFNKISQVGAKIGGSDLFFGYKGIFLKRERFFSKALSDYLAVRFVYLANSGTAAFYLILKTLRCISSKNEVILPAYTAPAMILPILRSGLKPVLCDISLRDFNLDLDLAIEVASKDSLCIVPTHMFGIAVAGINNLKRNLPKVFVIEDCAQSMGTQIQGRYTGNFSDVAFLSFNRGKNLPTYTGGCILTNSAELAKKLESKIETLEEQNLFLKFILPFKMTLFSLAIKPQIYSIFYPLISQFKDGRVLKDFSVKRYTDFQAGLGLSLLKSITSSIQKRYQNGMALLKGLTDIEDIILPCIPTDTKPAFNRLPIVFKNLRAKERVESALRRAGIDTSSMYLRPLHHIFDLGYRREDFPQANYLAERLITLPAHPLVNGKDIIRIIEIIRGVLG